MPVFIGIDDLFASVFIVGCVVSAARYHLRHGVAAYFQLRARAREQGDVACIPSIKQAIVGVSVLMALWVCRSVMRLILCFAKEWVYIYTWAVYLYMGEIMVLATSFVLPALLAAQMEMTTALRYPSSDYVKGDEKKGAHRGAAHRAALVAVRCCPAVIVVRLVIWTAIFFSTGGEAGMATAQDFSVWVGFAMSVFLFALAGVSTVSYMTAKDRTLRDAPVALNQVYALTMARHLFDVVVAGIYLVQTLRDPWWQGTNLDIILGPVFVAWTAVASVQLIYRVFSTEVDDYWHERPAYLGRGSLKDRARGSRLFKF